MTAFLVMVAIGLGTYALRVVMFVFVGSRSIPAGPERLLAFVGPAAIGALVATMVLTADGRMVAAPWPELVAIGAGFLVVRRTGNVLHALGVGLPVFWALSVVLP